MTNKELARKFLKAVGMPERQQADVCVYTLLALAQINVKTKWADAKNEWTRIHDIISFTNSHYKVTYAENSRETFRKQALHHFRNAGLIEDNGLATNSPNYRYRLTVECLELLKTLQSKAWDATLQDFLEKHETLISIYASKKRMKKMPVNIDNKEYSFSTGKHNVLQKAILEEFAPRFAPSSQCLYVGDSTDRDLVKNVEQLEKLGISITEHDKMPDVVLYRTDKNWLYYIEAVTSVGPVNAKRIEELNALSKDEKVGKIFVTAFLDFNTYKRFANDLAWETEVWIAELPEHMIHLNGDKFLGPR